MKCIARPANSTFLFVDVVLNFKTQGTYSDYIISSYIMSVLLVDETGIFYLLE
jgi:hypothetical protein